MYLFSGSFRRWAFVRPWFVRNASTFVRLSKFETAVGVYVTFVWRYSGKFIYWNSMIISFILCVRSWVVCHLGHLENVELVPSSLLWLVQVICHSRLPNTTVYWCQILFTYMKMYFFYYFSQFCKLSWRCQMKLSILFQNSFATKCCFGIWKATCLLVKVWTVYYFISGNYRQYMEWDVDFITNLMLIKATEVFCRFKKILFIFEIIERRWQII